MVVLLGGLYLTALWCVRLIPAFLFAACAVGQFPSPTLTEATTKVSDHVFMTTGFPNVVYVVGDNATLVVDTGLGTANGALVARVAKRLSKGPKLFLTTTHYHPEHAAGIGGFPPDTILIRPAVQQRELEKEGDQTMAFFRNSSSVRTIFARLGPPAGSGHHLRGRGETGVGWRRDRAADVLGRRAHGQ